MSGIRSICGKCGHEKGYHTKRGCRIGVCSCTGFVDKETYQKQVQTETDAAWALLEHEVDAQIADAVWDQLETDDICDCGHPTSNHHGEYGCCLSPHCDCPQFGTPTYEYEQEPTGTNVGGDPGGFMIYE